MATQSCPGFMCCSRFFSLVIPAFSLFCHSRESGNPGQKKSLCFLDLRVKPEDDKTKK